MAANTNPQDPEFLAAQQETLARYTQPPLPEFPTVGQDPASAAVEAQFAGWFAEDAAAETELAAYAQEQVQVISQMPASE